MVVNMIATVSICSLFQEVHGFNEHHHLYPLCTLCSRKRSEKNVITVFLEMGIET